MSYKLVVDSCCDLPDALRKDPGIEVVPLSLEIGDYQVMDDEHFDQLDFIARVAASPNPAKTACPSPDRYMRAFTGDFDEVYVVTLSSPLSGSYNSAVLGKNLYEEEYDDGKKIHVLDSWSACCGEANIAILIRELMKAALLLRRSWNRRSGTKRRCVPTLCSTISIRCGKTED